MPKAKSTKNSSGESDLSYNEAHTAMQLTLAALQANDLDVEEMAGLYRRARGYLDRCEVLLTKVEEEVMVWNEGSETPVPLSDSPLAAPNPASQRLATPCSSGSTWPWRSPERCCPGLPTSNSFANTDPTLIWACLCNWQMPIQPPVPSRVIWLSVPQLW